MVLAFWALVVVEYFCHTLVTQNPIFCRHGYIYLFDAHLGGIFRASLDGSSVVRIVDTKEFGAVGKCHLSYIRHL